MKKSMTSKASSKSTKSPAERKKKSSVKKKKSVKPKSAPRSETKETKKTSTLKNLLFENAKEKVSRVSSTASSKIDDLREQLKKSAKEKEQASKETPPPEQDGRPPLPKGALNVLLSLPFQMAGEQTGYYYQIPPRMQPMMENMAEQVMIDFGPEVAGRYINLAVFVGCYGHCFLEFRKGLKDHAEKMIELEKRKQKNQGV